MDPTEPPSTPGRASSFVALVSMPWLLVESPSIQLGLLAGALQRAAPALTASTFSFHLAFLEFAAQHTPALAAMNPAEYEEISTRWSNVGAPDWVFAVPPHGTVPRLGEKRFAAQLRGKGMPVRLVRKLTRLRSLVPAFLDRCVEEICATGARVVGFTLVYSQTLSSVALARALKARDPSLTIVFGGACCEGPMGPALMRGYDVIDFVVRGEGEDVFPKLVTGLANGDHGAVRQLPGVCYREAAGVAENATHPSQRVAIEDLPLPIYDEYFARLAGGALAGTVLPLIPYQSARGCWWGMKSHCTFCGLNGTDMEFRSKSAPRAYADLLTLSRRYGVVDFTVVDNIMDVGYLSSLIPQLAAGPHDLSLFCETKANLTAAQVAALGAAGVRTIQPGIESLSTPILKLMGKGVSALQNIRLLKWGAQRGMHVIWNLLFGFPGETSAQYEHMARLVPSLVHLAPPNMGPVMLARFSPYHADPERYGLTVGPPLAFYGTLFDVPDEVLDDLAADFEHTYVDGRDPKLYVAELWALVERWQREAKRNQGSLSYRRGPGFLIITDLRTTTGSSARYSLDEAEAEVYLACDAGATIARIRADVARRIGRELPESEVATLLREFVAARVMYEEDGKFLSLAIPAATSWGVVDRSARIGDENPVSRHAIPDTDAQRGSAPWAAGHLEALDRS